MLVSVCDENGKEPLTDWYYTSTADYCAFRNRSVVGGLFINLLD